jgi:hypothetical protein
MDEMMLQRLLRRVGSKGAGHIKIQLGGMRRTIIAAKAERDIGHRPG